MRAAARLLDELRTAGHQEEKISVDGVDLRVLRALTHHDEIALLIDQIAPAYVALEDQALLGIVVIVRGQSDPWLHTEQVSGPAGVVLLEELLDLDPGHAGADPILLVAPHVGQRFQLLKLGHTREHAALERGRGRHRSQRFRQQPCRLPHLRHQLLGRRR
ncbi:MAG: hypothetical protein NTW28_00475, partial [Candidatus Solibacter sp.]|nr:hypothetical protein [Candidatus Solibacter sp.]